MPNQEPLSLQQALVEAMRRIRRRHGWSQDRLAEMARWHGLSWTRSTVSDLEAQPRRRDLSIDEFVLLPDLLDVSESEVAEDILRHEDREQLLDARGALQRWLAENLPGSRARSGWLKETEKQIKDIRAALARDRTRHAEKFALRQAEKNAARALRAEPIEVAEAALRLWGHGVTEERDRRVDEVSGKGDRSRRLSHATRRLIVELRDEIGR